MKRRRVVEKAWSQQRNRTNWALCLPEIFLSWKHGHILAGQLVRKLGSSLEIFTLFNHNIADLLPVCLWSFLFSPLAFGALQATVSNKNLISQLNPCLITVYKPFLVSGAVCASTEEVKSLQWYKANMLQQPPSAALRSLNVQHKFASKFPNMCFIPTSESPHCSDSIGIDSFSLWTFAVSLAGVTRPTQEYKTKYGNTSLKHNVTTSLFVHTEHYLICTTE